MELGGHRNISQQNCTNFLEYQMEFHANIVSINLAASIHFEKIINFNQSSLSFILEPDI